MKKYLFYLILILGTLTITSCTKSFLEKQNQNDLSGNSFWKTRQQALQAITATYGALQSAGGDKWTWFEETYIASEYKTDAIINNKAEGYGKSLHGFTYTTDESSFTNLWHMCFAGINRANQCIENIPNVSSNVQTGLSDTEKKELIAEAKFLRAHFYFMLLNYFKNVPLITSTPKSNAAYYPKEATENQIWLQIESDLKEAKQFLPETRSADEAGRVTKYTAGAYLGKAFLFQEKFKEANDEFVGVINSNRYGLLPDFSDNFNGTNENGKESLFEIQFSANRANGNDERTPMAWEVSSYALNGWELFYPSPWLANELKKDKKADGSYSDRVYGTMFFDDAESEAAVVDQPGVIKSYAAVKNDLNYPVFFKKYSYPTDLADNGYYTGININLMRYADVLLMHAEALNERGLVSEATAFVNTVRARSKAAPLSLMTQAQLRTQIRHHERPSELAMEYTIRWADLYRWSRSKVAPEPIKATMVAHQQEFANNFINGKHDIYPVPFSEISKNPNIKQVAGW